MEKADGKDSEKDSEKESGEASGNWPRGDLELHVAVVQKPGRPWLKAPMNYNGSQAILWLG